MRCLFLPDNLFASIIEEQALFSRLVKKPFRKIFPIFKTDRNFDSLTIYPPIALNGYIVRLCNVTQVLQGQSFVTKKQEKKEGFVLGYAGTDAEYLIEHMNDLKSLARQATFSVIKAKSWYFADVEYKKIRGNLIWSVTGQEWTKKKHCKEHL